MFAIVDIETCGGKFDYPNGRIIEICILIHNGERVIDNFTTLINPECTISYMYTNITGISNEMVQHAPKFHEVAKQIVHYLHGKTFVAHNVHFDYNFIKQEFASIGYVFNSKKICTVTLSRKLIPGKKSYSLGVLCESLGIKIIGRHRAEGDAIATAELLEILLKINNEKGQQLLL